MRQSIRLAGVVIPAHNEAELLPDALFAVRLAANQAARDGIRVEVVVVADACDDATDLIARKAGCTVVTVDLRSVGRARNAGLKHILKMHGHLPRRQIWLATTDADSRVPPQWLVVQLALANSGADLVLGTVDVDDWSGQPAHVEAHWRAAYVRGDGHPHVHGANVGARADAYLAVGGFAALDVHEDVELAAALRHRSVVRTAANAVLTSARAPSRTPGGFADYLAGLA